MPFIQAIIALFAGCLITLSLKPFSFWPLAILAGGVLYTLIINKTRKQTFFLSFLFSTGLFLSGASWVFVSINEFGQASTLLSSILTILFCCGIALCNSIILSLFFYFKKKPNSAIISNVFYFSAIGTASEFMRSWLLTGFPWLFIGYSQTSAPLAGWASLFGVYGISFILYASGALLASLLINKTIKQQHTALAVILIVIWGVAPLLHKIEWSRKNETPLTASLVQANISQHEKWSASNFQPTLALYKKMSQPQWPLSDIVIWPEAAIPAYYSQVTPFINEISTQAEAHKSALITGIPSRTFNQRSNSTRTHNSIIAVGNASGIYHKQHLVPFGEYIPFSSIIGKLMGFFELPLSGMHAGDKGQAPLRISGWQTNPLICYEIVYPSLTAQAAKQSDVLVTISNDSWFGASLGPVQHLQMAQMRAIENGRYVLRSTGNGISAIIDNKGNIVKQSVQFQREVLRGDFHLMQGLTPWTQYGYWLIHLLYLTPLCITIGARLALYVRPKKTNN